MPIDLISASVILFLPFLAALFLIAGMVMVHKRIEENRAKSRNEHPPIPRKLRRTPGHSLQREMESLEEQVPDLLVFGILGIAASISGTVLCFWKIGGHSPASVVYEFGWQPFFQNPKGILLIVGLMSLVFGGPIWAYFRLRRAWSVRCRLRKLRLGLSGEQAVAEVLADAMEYRSYHDIPGAPFGNIDHVAVGVGGIYAVETKTRNKKTAPPGKLDHVVEVIDGVLKFPWHDDSTATKQAIANARWLEKELRERTGTEVFVQPLVVVPGWYIERKTKPTVVVINDTSLAKFLQSQPPIISAAQITQISRVIIDKVSDVEF